MLENPPSPMETFLNEKIVSVADASETSSWRRPQLRNLMEGENRILHSACSRDHAAYRKWRMDNDIATARNRRSIVYSVNIYDILSDHEAVPAVEEKGEMMER
jgi:predicted  nucleic acid-binding Zn-ribbon protein